MSFSANRLYLRRLLRSRTPKILLFLFFAINLLDVLRIHRNIADGERIARGRHAHAGNRERVYIASMHFNNGKVIRDHWNSAVLGLTEAFGPDNVFVSVYESGSWDDTKPRLLELQRELATRGVPHRVEVSDTTHKDEMENEDKGEGWIDTPRGRRELRRIPYLARLRNKTLKDLFDLSEQGQTFDKVLFLNDVIFSTEDVLNLMNTNGGDYAAACSLDFAKPPSFYDTFALRDIEGHKHVMQAWPYFRAGGSRYALANNLDAVPVTSCWNGIVVMPAEPFTSSTRLRFRGVSDSLALHHLEGSECCLIHADNPLSRTMGVYLNPRVRVGYNQAAYQATHPSGTWVSSWGVFKGLWVNRVRRWTAWIRSSLESWTVRSRVSAWEKEAAGNHEPGEFCLINEMQVLAENGWAHV